MRSKEILRTRSCGAVLLLEARWAGGGRGAAGGAWTERVPCVMRAILANFKTIRFPYLL